VAFDGTRSEFGNADSTTLGSGSGADSIISGGTPGRKRAAGIGDGHAGEIISFDDNAADPGLAPRSLHATGHDRLTPGAGRTGASPSDSCPSPPAATRWHRMLRLHRTLAHCSAARSRSRRARRRAWSHAPDLRHRRSRRMAHRRLGRGPSPRKGRRSPRRTGTGRLWHSLILTGK
jgi:hypothetical protein